MKQLEEIDGIEAKQVELLEAAGYLEPSALKNSSVEELHSEIKKANETLEILEVTPSIREVAGWWNQVDAEEEVFTDLEEVSGVGEDTRESNQPTLAVEDAPVAIPVSAEFAKEQKIDFGALPKAGEKLAEPVPSSRPSVVPETKKAQPREADRTKKITAPISASIRQEKVMSMDEFREKGGRVAPLERTVGENITKTTRGETNQGVAPESRRFIRGVLHKEPGSVVVSAVATLLSAFLAVAGVVLTPLIFWDKEEFFLAVFAPGLILLAVIIWFSLGRKAVCPVCRQRQFVPKSCLKHVRAHRIRGLGYMVSTALHLLMFRWFRCIFCGTSIRLKE